MKLEVLTFPQSNGNMP